MAWLRVSKSEKCAVCGKADWCQRSSDGSAAHCMRVESTKAAAGPMGGWIHRLAEPLPPLSIRVTKREKPNIDWSVLAQTMFTAPAAAEERYYLATTLGVKESALVELQVGRGWDEYRGLPYSSWPESHQVSLIRRN